MLAAEEAYASVQDVGCPRGRLRVLALMGFGNLHLVPLLPEFLREHPGIQLDLVLDDHIGRVLDDDFDVALRAGLPPRSSLVVRKLRDLHSVVCASPAYLSTHSAPRRPVELEAHRCLVYSYSNTPEHWSFYRGEVRQSIRIPPTCGVNNSDALCALTMAGMGIARLPGFVAAPHLRSGELVPLLRDYTLPSVPLNVLLPSRRYLPRRVRVFVDMLVGAFAGDAPWERAQ